ncbi:hypothetical protein [Stieleria varia]|uniref:Uncharacterized protein n=1 Tax=Stieleria varia TaxID=2528005 RepID=A0A5C6A2W5_9BACT|nr:hypothetical protein [Stieleria varia]TWT92743.1 hypothetical protein Pla52n_61080 [Stieleria varia]
MNIQSFLEHHGIVRNPFAEEDAQTDPVFKEYCISSAYHPIWDKVYGDPSEPSTAMIFGPKGSGKTAMRLQIDRHLRQYNDEHPGKRVYVIRYDDFNPFLDHFCERLSRRTTRKPERVLDAWRLWDHMDSILCLGVTQLVDQVLKTDENGSDLDKQQLRNLDRTASRDLLLLAACYDQSNDSSFTGRWDSLRKHLRYGNFMAKASGWFAAVWAVAVLLLFLWLMIRGSGETQPQDVQAGAAKPQVQMASMLAEDTATEEQVSDAPSTVWDYLWVAPLLIVIGAAPYLIRLSKCQWAAMGIRRHMRVGRREIGSMRKVLHWIPDKELASQPLPRYDRTDDRYELLNKLQSVLDRLGYKGTIVLMDRVDEPHMTGGKPELMRRFVWPILDNKLLKHPGLGFKMMLPQELHRDMERESRDFHERARLDKQNVIPSFQWTGESLYDLARARMMACADQGRSPEPKDLFQSDLDYQRMISAFQSLRVPRHLFRFLYRVLVDHCNRYTDANPEFKIKAETFETNLAVYARELDPSVN